MSCTGEAAGDSGLSTGGVGRFGNLPSVGLNEGKAEVHLVTAPATHGCRTAAETLMRRAGCAQAGACLFTCVHAQTQPHDAHSWAMIAWLCHMLPSACITPRDSHARANLQSQ